MKTRLQTSLGQQLVLTPQLQQAIKLLQMSATELELEIAQAVESNPLLDWADSNDSSANALPLTFRLLIGCLLHQHFRWNCSVPASWPADQA